MSAPFEGPPGFDTDPPGPDIHRALAGLTPPRKHYQWYYGTPSANDDMRHCHQGLPAFLRGYFHLKSADWPGNAPFPLAAWNAEELAKLPHYYVMEREHGMAETVARLMASRTQVTASRWLPEAELQVYAREFARTGFQGGLQWYRCLTGAAQSRELQLFAGAQIQVPACFIAGARDWGIYQKPGALQAMQETACADFTGCDLIEGAGHWVQQERPEAVVEALLGFLER